MPFKIYTYEDPYKLDKADFWSEISALPHFCSARTLVNGLKAMNVCATPRSGSLRLTKRKSFRA